MVVVKDQEGKGTKFNMSNLYKQGHMILFIIPTVNYCLIFQCNRTYRGEIDQIIEGQKTAPMSPNFVWPVIP